MFTRKLINAFPVVLLLVTVVVALTSGIIAFSDLQAKSRADYGHPGALRLTSSATPTPGAKQIVLYENNQGGASSNPWYIYKNGDFPQNHGEWTNWMPKEAGKMIKLSLVDKGAPFSPPTAVRVDVTFQDPGWCGIAVASAPDYWGETPGSGYDLSKAKKLVFYAKGEKGGESVQIKMAVTGDKKFGDSARMPTATPWLTLTKEWTRYELPLEYKRSELKRVITPFVFVTSRDHNATPAITF